MKKINKKIFLIMGMLLIAAGILSLAIHEKQRPKPHSDYVAEDPMVLAANSLNALGRTVQRFLLSYMIGQQPEKGDIFKVDFTLPGQEGFGDNPEHELFNNQGGGALILSVERLQKFSSNPQLIFTIANRIEGMRTEETDLIMVLTDLNEEICNFLRQAADVDPVKKSNTAQAELDLTPFPGVPDQPVTIRLPENKKSACIQAQNRLYYVHALYPR